MFKLTNRQQRRSLWVLLVGLLLLVVLLIPTTSWVKSSTKEQAAQHNSQLSPLIMIPGSSATKNRFDTLVKLLNQGSATKHSLLKVEVYNSGKITYTGKIRRGDTEPIIVVAFENNHDSSLTVLSVMGTKTYNSDGLVPEGSVEAGKYIYQKVVKHYTTMTVTGTDAQHSDLPQNQQIVSLIKEYILNQNGNRPGNKNRSNRQNQSSSN